ncbi:MAG: DNA glycosylase AlkZ-like family protein, partial [Nocardioidaceae bacterium]
MTRRLTPERLQAMTLRRQFPAIRGRRGTAIDELYRRLGPVQTQVPSSAFVFMASRLPGVSYDAVVAAFEEHDLVKASNIRATVHSSNRVQHAWLAAVAERPRSLLLRNQLRLDRRTPSDVTTEIERLTSGGWRERKALVEDVRSWLAEHESPASADALSTTMSANLVWGHAALVRRPGDTRWETRTDTLHRYAPDLYPVPRVTTAEATRRLVRQHLGAYGPATRRDIAWWMGTRLTDVDQAVDGLGEEVVRLPGPEDSVYLDLAEPPRGNGSDPGLRLLPEFDGLLLGYEGPGRDRFVEPEHLGRLTGRTAGNGLMRPLVLN